MLKDTGKITFISNPKNSYIKREYDEDVPFNPKRAKIIVRNLPFKNLSEDKLKQWFKEFGEIDEVNVLRKEDGKFVGCGFVQFKKIESAAKAVERANQREISGRKIIVDWAIPKDTYLQHMKIMKEGIKQEAENEKSDGSFSGDELPYDIDVHPTDANVLRKSETHDHLNESEYSDSDDEKYNVKVKTENVKVKYEKKGNESKPQIRSDDVQEGRTLFIRNLPFSTTNDDLKECFIKFGPLEYALICMDKLTNHSKGSGFIKFKRKESADMCLLQNNKIHLQEHPLSISLALSRETVKDKMDRKVTKDSRNLYLAREGLVTAGSKAAQGVSASDMTKRLEIEHWKSQILKNLHMFISDKRLVVHNLPPDYDDPKLKALFLKYSNPKSVITEAKVMRDKKKFDGNGIGVSKEFGFVTFSKHEDALHALRSINNNPTIFSVSKRPIVTFSVESKVVLNMKQKRMEKSRMKLGIDTDKTTNKLMKLNRKQRRYIRRKEKIIEKRREAKKLKKGLAGSNESAGERVATVSDGNKKRKMSASESDKKINKKMKVSAKGKINETDATNEYCGVVSEPGKKVKLRSRFKLKNQARIHRQNLKEDKLKRKRKAHKR